MVLPPVQRAAPAVAALLPQQSAVRLEMSRSTHRLEAISPRLKSQRVCSTRGVGSPPKLLCRSPINRNLTRVRLVGRVAPRGPSNANPRRRARSDTPYLAP